MNPNLQQLKEWKQLALDRGRALNEIAGYLTSHRFTIMPNSEQPPWYTNIKAILHRYSYKI